MIEEVIRLCAGILICICLVAITFCFIGMVVSAILPEFFNAARWKVDQALSERVKRKA